jgi:Asp-tRNA(Asn)/Glu-tRNA(Gln) amidotransferase A subunit family amidase
MSWLVLAAACSEPGSAISSSAAVPAPFVLLEARIADIHSAIEGGSLTATQLVERYLQRIQAYNGTCVKQPDGILGRIEPIPEAGQINALSTVNLRPAARAHWGFDERKARSMTDTVDNDPALPDALEVAAALDAHFAATGKFVGPLHGVVIAVKDQYDTADMRTTSGGDAAWANDRPPDDATFVARLRAAGAIILAKANLAEYASGGARSAFGGTFCNPYDTQRTPNASSAGSGTAVAANLVTCAIAEETTSSIRGPAFANSTVGIAPTQELVSRDGMIGAGLNTRTGPICRNVEDVARILSVIAGYDAKDEMTAFGVGRLPAVPYETFTTAKRLEGLRIGVLREYMDIDAFALADRQNIAAIEAELATLSDLGAELVDPGPGGRLFDDCLVRYAPALMNAEFAARYPDLIPAANRIDAFVDLAFDPHSAPSDLSIRNFERSRFAGERKYMMNRYLRERGDENIRSNADLIASGTFYDDERFPDRKAARQAAEDETLLDSASRLRQRFTIQQTILQCMQLERLDAVVYPTSNLPPKKLGSPSEPAINGRGGSGVWTFLGQQGFPAITVPAGFTTEVYDRAVGPRSDGSDDEPVAQLVGPVAAVLPIGIDFLGRPFDEPTLFKIAAAYEARTRHRRPPPGYGELQSEP